MNPTTQHGLIMLSNSNAPTPEEVIESSSDNFGLPFKTVSEDGEEYTVDLFKTTVAAVDQFQYELSKIKETLSVNGLKESQQVFYNKLFSPETVLLKVDAVGVIYVSNLLPNFSANFNFFFWDRRTTGRQRLLFSIMQWFFDEFGLNRLELRVHSLAHYALHRIYKLGAQYEGTLRSTYQYEDKLIDTHVFSVLKEEVTEEVLSKGFIERSIVEKAWHKRVTKRGG